MGKLRNLLATAAGGLVLAGCEAGANEKAKAPETTTAELTSMAAVVEVKVRTQAECRALVGAAKAEKLTCMREAKAARQAEIAALDAGLEEDTEIIETGKRADQERENKIEERRTRNKGLIKQIAEKAAQEEPNR